MDPRLFLDTAESLLPGEHEADCRSVVSRAYYSSFLVARELVETIIRRRLMDSNTHMLVRESLKYSSTPEGMTLSKKLASLHTKRKTSDYDLATAVDDNEAEIAISQAKEIIGLLELCLRTPFTYSAMQTAMIEHNKRP